MTLNSTLKNWILAGCCLLIALGRRAEAFPPAPHHTFFGVVRDELGNPLTMDNAEVILETTAGTTIKSQIVPGLRPGVNYQLAVPMDAGITLDAYKPTALTPTVPFKIKVKIGAVTYLPIEMKGDFSKMGLPGKSTRIDLTLGEDSDNDGIPDAWERAILAQMGPGATLANVNPGDDFDHDGLSNLQEYLAGTYAFDPADGFTLKIIGANGTSPILEFLAIRGRAYTVHASSDLITWTPVQFKLSPATAQSEALSNFATTDVRDTRIEAQTAPDQNLRFYKLLVQ